MRHPEAAHNPFYNLAPSWALYPLVGIATAATIIASQAVISGGFLFCSGQIALDPATGEMVDDAREAVGGSLQDAGERIEPGPAK